MTREEATRRNTMPNELKPNRSGKPDFFFCSYGERKGGAD